MQRRTDFFVLMGDMLPGLREMETSIPRIACRRDPRADLPTGLSELLQHTEACPACLPSAGTSDSDLDALILYFGRVSEFVMFSLSKAVLAASANSSLVRHLIEETIRPSRPLTLSAKLIATMPQVLLSASEVSCLNSAGLVELTLRAIAVPDVLLADCHSLFCLWQLGPRYDLVNLAALGLMPRIIGLCGAAPSATRNQARVLLQDLLVQQNRSFVTRESLRVQFEAGPRYMVAASESVAAGEVAVFCRALLEAQGPGSDDEEEEGYAVILLALAVCGGQVVQEQVLAAAVTSTTSRAAALAVSMRDELSAKRS